MRWINAVALAAVLAGTTGANAAVLYTVSDSASGAHFTWEADSFVSYQPALPFQGATFTPLNCNMCDYSGEVGAAGWGGPFTTIVVNRVEGLSGGEFGTIPLSNPGVYEPF